MTSNVITPGPIAGTEGMERLSVTDNLAASLKSVPLGRWGTVKEISDATVYLFSVVGNFLNGREVVVFLFYYCIHLCFFFFFFSFSTYLLVVVVVLLPPSSSRPRPISLL